MMRAFTPHLIPSLAAALLTMMVLTACKPESSSQAPAAVRPVMTMTVGSASAGSAGSYAAEIRPRVESQLAFRVGGKVIERLVEIGSVVKKDQVLLRLDPADLQLSVHAVQAQVAAAQANDDVAQASLKRSQELAKQNFISAIALEQATGQARATRAALEAAQANRAMGVNAAQYGVLRADADGVVTALSVETGQVVAVGMPVLKVAAGAQKDVVFAVPEGVAGMMRPGMALDVSLWAKPGVKLAATVRDISAMADPMTRTYTIKASLLDAQKLASLGSTASVTVSAKAAPDKASEAQSRLVIPLASVTETQGVKSVWLVEGGAVKRRTITLAPALPSEGDGTMVQVASGLSPGLVIVTAGVHTLAEGQKVRLN